MKKTWEVISPVYAGGSPCGEAHARYSAERLDVAICGALVFRTEDGNVTAAIPAHEWKHVVKVGG